MQLQRYDAQWANMKPISLFPFTDSHVRQQPLQFLYCETYSENNSPFFFNNCHPKILKNLSGWKEYEKECFTLLNLQINFIFFSLSSKDRWTYVVVFQQYVGECLKILCNMGDIKFCLT